jgi:hypothetical protein
MCHGRDRARLPSSSSYFSPSFLWNQILVDLFHVLILGVYCAVRIRILNLSSQVIWEPKLMSLHRRMNTLFLMRHMLSKGKITRNEVV